MNEEDKFIQITVGTACESDGTKWDSLYALTESGKVYIWNCYSGDADHWRLIDGERKRG